MPNLPKSDALKHLRKIRNQIPELEGLDKNSREIPVECEKWVRDAKVCIRNVFSGKANHMEDFEGAMLRMHPVSRAPIDASGYRRKYHWALESATSVLDSMIEEVEEYWADSGQASPDGPQANEHSKSNEIFIIHGRDENSKSEVARLLTQVGLEPIILAEQPSQGSTIIEKFERHATVAFAVALLTPDDRGSEKGEEEQMLRARQNVIFELGFFLGKLRRKRVCALTKGSIEIPSDYSGVVYIDLEQSPTWKYALVRELRKARLNADTNKIQ